MIDLIHLNITCTSILRNNKIFYFLNNCIWAGTQVSIQMNPLGKNVSLKSNYISLVIQQVDPGWSQDYFPPKILKKY